MLNIIRKSIKNIFIKIFLSCLLVSFVFWGIADNLSFNNKSTALKVGDIEYSIDNLKTIFTRQTEILEQELGRKLTPDELKSPDLHNDLINNLINTSLLSQEAKRLNILISDDMVKYQILTMPYFNKEGKFNKELFESILKRTGLTENEFIAKMKEEMAIEQLVKAISFNRLNNTKLTEQLLAATYAKRKIELFEIDSKSIKITTVPAETELRELLAQNEHKFSIPEKRFVSYVKFGLNNIVYNITELSEDEVISQYQKRKLLFKEPEKRTVMQLIFKHEEDANTAHKKIIDGMPYEDIAKQIGQSSKQTLLGTVTSEGFEPQIANAIFSLQKNQISEPIKTALGWYIFKVTEIVAESTKSLNEVKQELIKQLVEEKRLEKLNQLAQKINADINSNFTLDELSQKYNLTIYADIISDKKSPNAITNKNLLSSEIFASTAFSTQLKNLSSVIMANENEFVVLRVDNIEEQRVQDFVNIQPQLLKLWQNQRKNSMSIEFANNLRASLKDNTTTQKDIINREKNFTVKTTNIEINRINIPNIPYDLVTEVFKLKRNEVSQVYKDQNDNYFIAKLIGINFDDLSNVNKYKQKVNEGLIHINKEAILVEYIAHLKKRYEIKIYHTVNDN